MSDTFGVRHTPGRHEEPAVRALEAAVAFRVAVEQVGAERLLAVRADELVARLRRVGHASVTDSMRTSSRGRSPGPVSRAEIASTTSMPEATRPKTVCLPSSHGHASAVTMKNWLPLVLGPAFAIASAPRTTLWSLNSSSN